MSNDYNEEESDPEAKLFHHKVLLRAMPVLRNYIPRPVLIALDAGQSVWSASSFPCCAALLNHSRALALDWSTYLPS